MDTGLLSIWWLSNLYFFFEFAVGLASAIPQQSCNDVLFFIHKKMFPWWPSLQVINNPVDQYLSGTIWLPSSLERYEWFAAQSVHWTRKGCCLPLLTIFESMITLTTTPYLNDHLIFWPPAISWRTFVIHYSGGNLTSSRDHVFYFNKSRLCLSQSLMYAITLQTTGSESYIDRLLQCYQMFALWFVVNSAVSWFCRVPRARFLKITE